MDGERGEVGKGCLAEQTGETHFQTPPIRVRMGMRVGWGHDGDGASTKKGPPPTLLDSPEICGRG